ncbi:hypothetical protein EJB05_32520, partial [Eragrostis curvula]
LAEASTLGHQYSIYSLSLARLLSTRPRGASAVAGSVLVRLVHPPRRVHHGIVPEHHLRGRRLLVPQPLRGRAAAVAAQEDVEREALVQLLRVRGRAADDDVGARVGGLVDRLRAAVVAHHVGAGEGEQLRERGGDVAARRADPPRGRDVAARRGLVLPVDAVGGARHDASRQLRRVVSGEAAGGLGALGVDPEVEVGVHVPRVLRVGHREPDLVVPAAVEELPQERRELDVVGGHVERPDAGDGPPDERVDPARVDHREWPHRATTSPSSSTVRPVLLLRRVHVPELVGVVGGDAVRVGRHRDACGLHPVAGRQAPRDGDDEVGGRRLLRRRLRRPRPGGGF